MEKLKTINIKGKDYVEVNERLKYFRKNYPSFSLETEILQCTDAHCVFKATIKDELGRETKFFHLNPGSLKVKKGQKVKAGQHVAGVGNTGGSTGYHLHAELLIGGKHVDLADYLGGA
jgi:hypothetical protein